MKLESQDFTMDDIRSFMGSYRDRERDILADRLQRISDRIADIGPRVVREIDDERDEWTAHELLAHIAVVSKFYGILVHRIATGKLADLKLLEAVNLRDSAGRQLAEQEPGELVRLAIADQQRTIQALRDADGESLARSASADDGTVMTAEEVARMPLITHLEMHVEQLERMLANR
jgi:hypothetical protein